MNRQSHLSEEAIYEVVWPLGKSASRPVELAPALTDLNGKTICEIWDRVFRGDQMYAVLNDELRKKYPDIRIVAHQTLGDSHGRNERRFVADLPDLLRQHGCDAVISAVGA